MTSRVARGFHRIGIVLALPPLLLAGWLATQRAWLPWSSHPWDADPIVGQSPDDRMWGAYNNSLLLLGLAIALYAVARALGWIVDGFARS